MIKAKVPGISVLAKSNKCDMTVLHPAVAEHPPPVPLLFPDPLHNPDELMANFQHLTISRVAFHLARYFGHPGTTQLGGDLYLDPVPPDFVLEIGSTSTGRVEVEVKRDDYAALGMPEHRRGDATRRCHGTRSAGGLSVHPH